MKLICFLLVIPITVFAAPTPQELSAKIQQYGKSVFSSKVTPDDWSTVVKNISTGSDEWLAIVPNLASVVDFKQSSQLSSALYYALASNAKGVLKTLSILDKHHYKYQQGTDTSCVPPFDKIVNSEMQTYDDTRLFLLDAGPQAATCLWIMESWVEELKAEEARRSISK